MHIERMHKMIEKLTECALCELEKGVECVNTDEFGKVIDMIKDLADSEYKSIISKEMKEYKEDKEAEEKYMLKRFKEEYGEEDGERRYYDNYRYANGRFAPKGRGSYMPRRGYEEPPYYHMTPEMYKEHGPEYYRDMDRKDGKMYYTEPIRTDGVERIRDHREGKSGMSRRTYLETKDMHKGNTPADKQAKMAELEKYTKELAEDVTEMISDATPEERTMIRTKLQALAQKIQ